MIITVPKGGRRAIAILYQNFLTETTENFSLESNKISLRKPYISWNMKNGKGVSQ